MGVAWNSVKKEKTWVQSPIPQKNKPINKPNTTAISIVLNQFLSMASVELPLKD